MLHLAFSLVSFSVVLAGGAAAQQMPVINDITRTHSHVSDRNVDIRGLHIGQTANDAIKALEALISVAGSRVDTNTATVSIRDDRGNRFETKYRYQIRASFQEGEKNSSQSQTYEVWLTAPLIGERVGSIRRLIRYTGEEADLNALLSSVREKYGSPSIERKMNRGIEVVYVWFGGQQVTLTDANYQFQRRAGGAQAARCVDAAKNALSNTQYFPKEVRDDYPGCDLALSILINFGKRDDLVGAVTFNLIDLRRGFEQNLAMKSYLEQQLDAVVKSRKGLDAPKL